MVFKSEGSAYGGVKSLLNDSFDAGDRRNILWGPEYMAFFFRKQKKSEFNELIADLITLRALKNIANLRVQPDSLLEG